MATEAEIVAAYVEASKAVDAADAAVQTHFQPLIFEALDKGDISGAREIMRRMPDSVAKIFAMDAIRVAIAKSLK